MKKKHVDKKTNNFMNNKKKINKNKFRQKKNFAKK